MRTLRVVSVALLAAVCGCVTEGPPERAQPRPLQPQPPGLVVDRVVPAIDKLADDTDRNGYYDTFRVAIFMFASGYAQSIASEGSLVCTLTQQETGKVLAKWTLDPAQMKEAWGLSGVMPGYSLLLNMNQVGTDRLEDREALFSCTFTPTGGKPVTSLSRLVVMVGPLR
jgi:hypothetical protein